MTASTSSDAKVLYLEDEPLIALDGEQTLQDLGYTNVLSVPNLKRAEKAIEENDIRFAILDVHLGPDTTSLGLARMLKGRGVPVVFVTGYNPRELPDDVAGSPILEKPLCPKGLARILDEVA